MTNSAQDMWDSAVAEAKRMILAKDISDVCDAIINHQRYDTLPNNLQKVYLDNKAVVITEVYRRKLILSLGGKI